MSGQAGGRHRERKIIEGLLNRARKLARQYRTLTGKPLGITGEIAEFYAAKYLRLQLAPARSAGYDAIRVQGKRKIRIQIKGRCIAGKVRGRVPRITFAHPWDRVALVLLNEDFEATKIYETTRAAVKKALLVPGSKARNKRGTLAIKQFIRVGHLIWRKG
jgi:hypothetical protein